MKGLNIIIALVLFYSCGNSGKQSHENLQVDFKLPKDLKECSGIAYDKNYNLIWAIADGGNPNVLYGFDAKGTISKQIGMDVKNNDWEDLTMDKAGNIYVGDFGNNDNIRTDLAIYKITDSLLQKGPKIKGVTKFYYPEQKDFPPKKKSLFYDCEAFFEMDGNFYLFTKNRSKDFDGTTFIYKIPNRSGHFAAQRIGEFKTCADYHTCCITGAALSPDQTKMVLLGHSKIWLFENFRNDNFLGGKKTELDLKHYSQKEAVCFLTNDTLLIADERTKKNYGNVYKVALADLKSKP
ncbi:MAG: hypothetical protein QM710_14970 [Flavobacterium sp.]